MRTHRVSSDVYWKRARPSRWRQVRRGLLDGVLIGLYVLVIVVAVTTVWK